MKIFFWSLEGGKPAEASFTGDFSTAYGGGSLTHDVLAIGIDPFVCEP